MTIQGRVYGVQIAHTRNGTEYVTAGICDSLRNSQGEYQTRWINIAAWGRDAENLKKMDPGTAVIAICRVDAADPKSGIAGDLHLVSLSQTQDAKPKYRPRVEDAPDLPDPFADGTEENT